MEQRKEDLHEDDSADEFETVMPVKFHKGVMVFVLDDVRFDCLVAQHLFQRFNKRLTIKVEIYRDGQLFDEGTLVRGEESSEAQDCFEGLEYTLSSEMRRYGPPSRLAAVFLKEGDEVFLSCPDVECYAAIRDAWYDLRQETPEYEEIVREAKEYYKFLLLQARTKLAQNMGLVPEDIDMAHVQELLDDEDLEKLEQQAFKRVDERLESERIPEVMRFEEEY